MASSFDRWEKDPFFDAAEEVQESADRMESTYRTWIHARKDTTGMWNTDELRRDLQTALGTAKWQLEEFEREVRSSYSRISSEDARNRHKEFINAIEGKITKVEHSLHESQSVLPGGKASLPWVCLDEGEKDELALFLSGMPAIESNNPTWGEAKAETPRGIRRVASASADVGHWKILVSDDTQQWSTSSGSSGPMHKAPSLSGFLSSMESVSKFKWPRNGYRKLKAVDNHKETGSALLPTAELNRGNNGSYEKSKSSLDSSGDFFGKQLYGWRGAIQRQLQRSQYQMQYSQPVRIAISIVFLLCFIVVSAWSYKWYQSKVMGLNPLANTGGRLLE